MITKIKGGTVITEDSLINSDVYIDGDRIVAVTNDELAFDSVIDATGLYVSPAFVDIHTHGAGGHDFLDGTVEAFIGSAKAQAMHGAGTVIPTITSSTKENVLQSIAAFEKTKGVTYDGASMPGLHLEGPYFSPVQAGAQDPDRIKKFDKEEYMEFLSATDSIMSWTGAPELEGSEEFAAELTKRGILPCIGHSDADGECVKKAFENGFTHVTHLYSCTSTIHRKNAYRHIGIVESAYLMDDLTVEIIGDGIHVPADLLKFVYRFKDTDKIALVTDSMRGAGLPDGPSVIGNMEDGVKVILEDGVAKLPDRSAFAGSVAFCDRLVRNIINLAGANLVDAVKMAATNPARIIGLKDTGKIKKDFSADITIFDKDINIQKTIVKGRTVYSK